MLKMFRVAKFGCRLACTFLAFGALAACLQSVDKPDLSGMSDREKWFYHHRTKLQMIAPKFPFGAKKTCGNEYARLKEVRIKRFPSTSNISLWETSSTSEQKVRHVLWNEAFSCGYLVETRAPDGEGPLIDGKYIVVTGKEGGITAVLSDVKVEDVTFEGIYSLDFIEEDFDIVSQAYRERFVACKTETGQSTQDCRNLTQEWVNNNSAQLTIGLQNRPKYEAVTLYLIGDRLWWAGREIK